jgi:ligand-binding sensor domain-containing protein
MYALAQTPDGFLWIASEEGLVRFDGTEFFVPAEFQQKARRRRYAQSLWVAADGRLWIGSHGGLYYRTREGSFEYYDQESGLPARKVISANATDAAGGGNPRVLGRATPECFPFPSVAAAFRRV